MKDILKITISILLAIIICLLSYSIYNYFHNKHLEKLRMEEISQQIEIQRLQQGITVTPEDIALKNAAERKRQAEKGNIDWRPKDDPWNQPYEKKYNPSLDSSTIVHQ